MRSLFAALALGFGVLTGAVTTPTTAQALPAAPITQPAATPDTSVEKVGYYRRHRYYGHRHYGYRHHYGYRPYYSGFSFYIGPRYRHHGYRHYGYRHW